MILKPKALEDRDFLRKWKYAFETAQAVERKFREHHRFMLQAIRRSMRNLTDEIHHNIKDWQHAEAKNEPWLHRDMRS